MFGVFNRPAKFHPIFLAVRTQTRIEDESKNSKVTLNLGHSWQTKFRGKFSQFYDLDYL